MSLPMTAVGPLKVDTKPILTVSPATAELAESAAASESAVAPASQNAVLICLPPPRYLKHVSRVTRPAFFARNLLPPASTKARQHANRTFGPTTARLHHNSCLSGI